MSKPFVSTGSELFDMKIATLFIAELITDKAAKEDSVERVVSSENLDDLNDTLIKVWEQLSLEVLEDGCWDSNKPMFAQRLTTICSFAANNPQFGYFEEKKAVGHPTSPSTQCEVMQLCKDMGVTQAFGNKAKIELGIENNHGCCFSIFKCGAKKPEIKSPVRRNSTVSLNA